MAPIVTNFNHRLWDSTRCSKISLIEEGIEAQQPLWQVWLSNYIQNKVWDEITFSCPNLDGTSVQVLWISNPPSFIAHMICYPMLTSSNGNVFRVAEPLWRESTGHRCIPLSKVVTGSFDCFLWSAPEQTVEKTIETSLIYDAITLIMTSL